MADEVRDLYLALFPHKGGATADIPHNLRVGADTGVGFEVTIPPPAQQEPGRLDLNHPETCDAFSKPYYSNPSDHALSRS